jgi:hypothetical protein
MIPLIRQRSGWTSAAITSVEITILEIATHSYGTECLPRDRNTLENARARAATTRPPQ